MMEAIAALSLQSSPWIGSERTGRKTGGFFRIPSGFSDERRVKTLKLGDSRWSRTAVGSRHLELKISSSYKKSGDNFNNSVDEALILKRKSEDVLPYLNGRCIYLVGMMGSGKTTVGKILSEVLGYSFFDSDKLVEQAVGIASIAQIFKEHSEAFFRDNESKVLRDLSSMHRLVVATGGGAVIRPINWKYMKQGITIWLDVPLDALARRIAAVGTDSRPLLHQGSGDPYKKAFVKLTTLSEQRGKAYTNADARVSLEYIAAQQGHGDVSALTPTAIAIEALMKIECFLIENAVVSNSSHLQE
ncbi:shikimate kinase 3, chloroplastic-like [Phoenix dactylifera]|uniref:shikimate kinase n=1 Tax=Phoenix dactylifera TaxID=42345 RepID=A0A8B7CQX7_PHODC|nr:shikimate kinase 3, chloroplastic-like [Phoenix dactylifera]